jgi:hypothetical protein
VQWGGASLELIEVKALYDAHQATARPTSFTPQERREPFSIVFRGPAALALSQRRYDIRNESLGRIAGLFITPIGEDSGGRYYEAVFS